MSNLQNDVHYLNRFLRQLWPAASRILEAEVTHQAFAEVEERMVRMSRSHTHLDLTAQPAFFRHGSDSLKLRFPASATNTFTTRIYLVPGVTRPRISATIDLAIKLTISPDAAPNVETDVSVSGNVTGNLVDHFRNWKEEMRKGLEGEDLAKEIGYFSGARYNRAAVPDIPNPVIVYPKRERLENGTNIVLVPDGFDSQDLSRFDQIVDRLVTVISSDEDHPTNEPFYSFKTALHIWTIKPPQSTDGDHVVGGYTDARGQRRVAPANLARLAAIGRAAEATGDGQTVIVYIANRDASHFGGQRFNAMALGNVILQPVQDSVERDVWLVLHELGHSGLGLLGDEYVLDARAEENYLGLDLAAPNLTIDPEADKWQAWIDHAGQLPPWDDFPVTAVEGGGYFGRGIWRPAEKCAMRHSTAGLPFCAICREALTRGIQATMKGEQFLFRVTGQAQETTYVDVEPETNSQRMNAQIIVPATEPIDFTVEPVAGTLPEPWQVEGQLFGNGQLRIRRDQRPALGMPTPRTIFSFTARAGDRLRLSLRSRCPFTPWDDLPRYTVDFHCVPDPDTIRPPAKPDNTSGRQTSRNPAGTLQPVRLSAVSQDPNGQDIRIEFDVTRADQSFQGRVAARSGWLSQPAKDPRVTATVNDSVSMEGAYKVRARAVNRSGRRSSWSSEDRFTVRPRQPVNGGHGNDHGKGNKGNHPPERP
jgi:hypothetical protein